MTEETNRRLKKGFRILPQTDERIESHRHLVGNGERSAFIDEAVQQYCALLDGQSSRELLGDEVLRIVKAVSKDSSNHIARVLFKMTVELAMLADFIGEMGLELSPEEIRRFRNRACERVRKHHGLLPLEDILADADGE